MIRLVASTALPGPESVMIRTGRAGYSCARAGAMPTSVRRPSAAIVVHFALCVVTMRIPFRGRVTGLLGLDVRGAYHGRPFLGFVGGELAEFGDRHGEREIAKV